MNPTPSIALTLIFLAGLIACGDEGREKAHRVVDAAADQIEATSEDLRRALSSGAEDLERLRGQLRDGAGELSEAAKLEFAEQLADLDERRRELDERLEPARQAGAEKLAEWKREAAELGERCAAAWDAFQAAEQDSEGK